ncbi:MAG: murein biosynthesis integral membrane protein MurJ [Chloroflexi bacterium]|nr:murein biosynthesis integral membrane protein MurJ [Chloroflexota bacterium]
MHRQILRAAAIITLGNVLSRLLGLVREQVIAGLFGATIATDAFVIAATVPTMVYDLLIGGAISAAIVPVLSGYLEAGDQQTFNKVSNNLLVLASLLLILLVAILTPLAPLIGRLLGAGLTPEGQDLAIRLIRWIMPSIVFLGLAGVSMGILYARQVFLYPSLSAAAFNLGIILAAIASALLFGPRPESLVLGVVLGSLLQLLLQLPGIRGLPFRLAIAWRDPELRQILRLYAPVFLGLVISQVGVILDRNLASRTGEGNIAAMRFATTLVQLPIGLIASAISLAVLPSLSRVAAGIARPAPASVTLDHYSVDSEQPVAGDWRLAELGDPAQERTLQPYKATLELGVRLALAAMIPVATGMVILREPLVQLLFERGAFDAEATRRTALAFLLYAPQLPFVAVDLLLIYAFYARKDTLTPMLIGLLGVVTYAAVGLALLKPLGFAGLVIANTAQQTLHAIVLFFLLQRSVGSFLGRKASLAVGKMLVASLAMAAALALAVALTAPLSLRTWAQVFALAFFITIGTTVYVGAATLLRLEEVRDLWHRVRQRLTR